MTYPQWLCSPAFVTLWNSCPEAMAAGTPVVVSDTGGLSEIITHGENGLKTSGNAIPRHNVIRLLQDEAYAMRFQAGQINR